MRTGGGDRAPILTGNHIARCSAFVAAGVCASSFRFGGPAVSFQGSDGFVAFPRARDDRFVLPSRFIRRPRNVALVPEISAPSAARCRRYRLGPPPGSSKTRAAGLDLFAILLTWQMPVALPSGAYRGGGGGGGGCRVSVSSAVLLVPRALFGRSALRC